MLRHWTNVKPTLIQRILHAGKVSRLVQFHLLSESAEDFNQMCHHRVPVVNKRNDPSQVLPSKHKTLAQHWLTVRPPSTTLAQQ